MGWEVEHLPPPPDPKHRGRKTQISKTGCKWVGLDWLVNGLAVNVQGHLMDAIGIPPPLLEPLLGPILPSSVPTTNMHSICMPQGRGFSTCHKSIVYFWFLMYLALKILTLEHYGFSSAGQKVVGHIRFLWFSVGLLLTPQEGPKTTSYGGQVCQAPKPFAHVPSHSEWWAHYIWPTFVWSGEEISEQGQSLSRGRRVGVPGLGTPPQDAGGLQIFFVKINEKFWNFHNKFDDIFDTFLENCDFFHF